MKGLPPKLLFTGSILLLAFLSLLTLKSNALTSNDDDDDDDDGDDDTLGLLYHTQVVGLALMLLL